MLIWIISESKAKNHIALLYKGTIKGRYFLPLHYLKSKYTRQGILYTYIIYYLQCFYNVHIPNVRTST